MRSTGVQKISRSDPAALARMRSFWQALGSRTREMTPEDHDRALALTSHLPHLLASALAGILPEALHDLTATGFRDTTRVAAGDPELWAAIFAHNRPALLEALTLFELRLAQFRHAVEQVDAAATTELLAQAKKVRDALGS
jgi:prephenate dehydrogenase